MEEEVVEQVIRDDIEFDELIIVTTVTAMYHHNNVLIKKQCKNSPHIGSMFTKEILKGNDRRCHEQFRTEKLVFVKLCDRLRSYGLTSTRGVGFEEAMVMFLMTLGHGVGNRIIQEQFQHSGETVSRQFEIVLEKVIILSFDEIRTLEDYNEVPHYI
ncbi:hypothetical protein ACOSQ2_017314 [Xanthoceras sorbifolium]